MPEIYVEEKQRTRLVIDGVFFQLNSTGIARTWSSILSRWARSSHASEILVLDRAGTAPKFSGLRYRTIPPYRVGQGIYDRMMLDEIMIEEAGEIFASTYYTSTIRSRTLQVVYDMIPEVIGFDVERDPVWIEKHHAFRKADFFLCISNNTRADLHHFFPQISVEKSVAVHLGVDTEIFFPASSEESLLFREKYTITRPYFLLIGSGAGYKNTEMVTDALNILPSRQGFEVIMVSNGPPPSSLQGPMLSRMLRVLRLDDTELRLAYSGALAFVYPTLYEGFGLPILEAMACDCPVISNRCSSLPEVAGDAALYAKDAHSLANALCEIQKPSVQTEMVARGRHRVKEFSWDLTAAAWWKIVCKLSEEIKPRELPCPRYSSKILEML